VTSAGFADQIFQLKRRLVPGPDSVLQFTETGRFAETSTTLNAEVSVDDGLNWTSVWSRTGVGLNSALFDTGWNPHAVSLGAYSGKAVLVRFSLKSNGGPVAAGTTKDHGFFIDNILLTNGLELVDAKVTTLAGTATGFVLNRATAGASLMEGNSYYLSVAPRVGTRLFPSSPLTVASVPVVSAMATAASGPARHQRATSRGEGGSGVPCGFQRASDGRRNFALPVEKKRCRPSGRDSSNLPDRICSEERRGSRRHHRIRCGGYRGRGHRDQYARGAHRGGGRGLHPRKPSRKQR
jgi:hypothetical protein